MSIRFKPYREDLSNNRPGVELFVWRAAVFLVFLVLSAVLFTLRFDSMSLIKKAVTISCSLALLYMTLYHAYLALFLKNLCYEITADRLIVRSFLLHDEILFSEIQEVRSLAEETLVLQKKHLFSYFRETPQIVYPVAQLGTCSLEGLGAVRFYSFVDTLKEPGNLLFIRTRENRRYALSPIAVDQFMNLIRRAESDSAGGGQRSVQ